MIQSNGDLIGKILGTCELEQQIGRGGMSVVYLAQQTRPSRKVAVKILLPNVPTNSQQYGEFLARFLREADVIARLEHNNIVRIYDCDLQDELAYLVMPYLAGGNLAHLLAQRHTLTLQEASKYITEAAQALDYAHSQGIIHRDLKPSNFLLQADGHLVLADFGIAYMMRDRNSPQRATLTLSGTVLGTPDYMAPEMMLGRDIDYRVDIYELGIVLFQMLSGNVPYKGRTSIEIMLKHSEEPLPHLHHRNPTIPLAVDAVIQKAAAKQREDRYSSAGEFARALEMAIHEPQSLNAYYPPTVLAHGNALPSFDPTIPLDSHQQDEHTWQHTSTPPVPSLPTHLPSRTHRSKKVLLLGLSLIAVSIILAIITLQAAILPPALHAHQETTPPAQLVRNVVQQFYADLNKWDYPDAYKLRVLNDYCAFVNGYEHTEHVDLTINSVTPLKNGTFKVAISISATEKIKGGTFVTFYSGYHIVEKVNGVWKISPVGSLPHGARVPQPSPAAGITPTALAENTVQQFYSYLNQGNYPAAYYQLWGTDTETGASTRFCQFLNDYPQSKRYVITSLQSTQRADGTVQVIASVNETQPGTPNATYPKTYILNQENSRWKIQNGALV